jgi:hypothetical protein
LSEENSPQRATAGHDAYVAGRDIKTVNIYRNDPSEDFRPPFLVVDDAFLVEERKKPKSPYIARPPLWADVVHGQNADSRFLEREHFGELLSSIDRQLLEPLFRGSDRRLPTLFVTGDPGCGKSTLVRHVIADARAWLAGDGSLARQEYMLVALVRPVRELPRTQVSVEVIEEARNWLADHPEAAPVREALTALEAPAE